METKPSNSRERMFDKLARARVIPVFSSSKPELNRKALMAVHKAGVRVFEFTHRQARSYDCFADLVDFAREHAPGLELGVGTVKQLASAQRFHDTGAKFIVGPTFDPDILDWALVNEVVYCPAGATPTEIDLILKRQKYNPWVIAKLFPGGLHNPDGLKAILAANNPEETPMRIMVTGGVTNETIPAWFAAGATAVGAGSMLGKEADVEKLSEAELVAKVLKTIEAIPADFKPTFISNPTT